MTYRIHPPLSDAFIHPVAQFPKLIEVEAEIKKSKSIPYQDEMGIVQNRPIPYVKTE